MSRGVARLVVIVAASVLASCGYQLQGALTVPAEMERTYISTVDQHSRFYRELRAQLRMAGVNLVETDADATATFSVFFDETAQRVLSVSSRNVPTEYEVFYTIVYALNAGTKTLLNRQMLTLTRDYTYDETLVLGKAREEELLREAIVKDLVRVVLKQMSTL